MGTGARTIPSLPYPRTVSVSFSLLIALLPTSLFTSSQSLLTSYTGAVSRYSPAVSMMNDSSTLFIPIMYSGSGTCPPGCKIAQVIVPVKGISCTYVSPSSSSSSEVAFSGIFLKSPVKNCPYISLITLDRGCKFA